MAENLTTVLSSLCDPGVFPTSGFFHAKLAKNAKKANILGVLCVSLVDQLYAYL